MGLAWAAAWMPLGLIVGFIVDRDGKMDEPWIAVGAYPGFLCGLVFAVMAGYASHRGSLGELSYSEAAFRGAASGLQVGAFWFAVVLISDPPRGLFEAGIVAGIALASALSGAAAVLVARAGHKNGAKANV